MHKHSQKHNGDPRLRWRDANERISGDCQAFIESFVERIEGGRNVSLSYLLDQYRSKFCDESLVPAASRRENAIRKWKDTETKNKVTNDRIRGLDRGYNILPRVSWYTFLRQAQRFISEILGPLNDSIVIGSFSGGASTSRRRTESHPAQKYTGMANLTIGVESFLEVIHREIPLFREHRTFHNDLFVVEGAELFTVPKKTDIDRCACKEPDINMFLQKGVGNHIRRRLKRVGINLNDQSINRRLARLGSIEGNLSTLDLSSASDTVTIKCVQSLLPTEWFLYLNDIRSHNVSIDRTFVQTEMFSSMGNGFTFELESLIFFALMRTTAYFRGVSGIVSVYGDDIIIPSGLYDDAVWVLSEFGFSVNPDKSFREGPFRESCGGHYHLGEDVTPFYLKRRATHLTDVIRVANQFRHWLLTDPARQYEFPNGYQLWCTLRDFVPRDLWGGYDTAVDTQLVSPDRPINRLSRVTKKEKLPPVGLYLQWHNSYWNRLTPPNKPGGPVLSADTHRCRRRKAIGTSGSIDLFNEEVIESRYPG